MKARVWVTAIAAFAGLAAGCTGPPPSSSFGASPTPTPSGSPYPTPPARANAAMAFDPLIGKLVMVGGFNELGLLSDSWGWDGKGWTLLATATTPPVQNPSMAFDATAHQLYLFGSGQAQAQQAPVNMIWTWKPPDWAQAYSWNTPNCGKSCIGSFGKPFTSGSATYDAKLGKVVLLAGGPFGPGDETWSWDGTGWSQIPTAHRPLSVGCCPVYDDASHQLVTLGYAGNSWGGINRTWIFDGSDWQLSPAFTPDGMDIATVAGPTGAGVLLLVGRSGPAALETWSWNGSGWQRLDSSGPPDLSAFTLGSDPVHKHVILFGGRDAYGRTVSDTWIWDGKTWHKIASNPTSP